MKSFDRRYFVNVLWLVIGLVAACSAPVPQPSPTLVPTPTVAPSPTPIPVDEWVREGNALLWRSDFAGAEAAYRRAIEAKADYAPAYMGLSQVYYWWGRDNEVLAPAQKAVALAPDNAMAHVALAAAQMDQLAVAEAVKAGEQAVQLDGKNAAAQAMLAHVYLLDRRYDEALKAAEQAVTLDPALAEAYFALGRVHRDMADFSRGRVALEQAITLEPDFAPWHVTLGHFWTEAKSYPQATASFSQALELAPDYIPAILGLAAVSIDQRNFPEAEAHIQRVVELSPHEEDAYTTWGYLYLIQEDYDKALAQFRQALAEEADDWYAKVSIGWTFARQGECDSATGQFQELMSAQPRFAGGPIGLGLAKLCSGDVSKALEYLRKAANLEPYNSMAQIGMGGAYSMQGRWEEALSAYAEALRLSLNGSQAHAAMGATFLMQGETDLAKAEYELALRADPNSIEAYIGLSRIFFMQDKHAEARVYAGKAIALQENNWDAQKILGIALIVEGKPAEGAKALQRVIEEEPEDALARFYLGLAYKDLKQYSQAKKEIETYQALNPQEQDPRVNYLIEALGQGYRLDEEKVLDDLKAFLEEDLNQTVAVRVEQIDGKRTLVVSTAASQDQQKVMNHAINIASMAAYLALRTDPPIEKGLIVRFERAQKPLFTVETDISNLKHYIDGLTSSQTLIRKLKFSRETPPDPASMKTIMTDVSEVRELDPEGTVPYAILSVADMEKQVKGLVGSKAQTLLHDEAVLSLLGVITPGLSLSATQQNLYVEQVVGFYDSEQKKLYVRQGERQTTLDQATLAHEYAHALQDQHFDLDNLLGTCSNGDQCAALRALIEGDATLASYLYADEHIPIIDMRSATQPTGVETGALEASPNFIRRTELFPYQEGLTFVYALYSGGEWAAVDKAYKDPPQSTEQILHPERYREGDKPQPIELPNLTANLTGDWQEVDKDVMGELSLQLTLAQHVGPGAASLAAKGWGGDRYALLQGQNDAYVLVMRTYWDSKDETDEFWKIAKLWMAHRPGYSEEVKELVGEVKSYRWSDGKNYVFAARRDRYVVFILGADQEVVERIGAALTPN